MLRIPQSESKQALQVADEDFSLSVFRDDFQYMFGSSAVLRNDRRFAYVSTDNGITAAMDGWCETYEADVDLTKPEGPLRWTALQMYREASHRSGRTKAPLGRLVLAKTMPTPIDNHIRPGYSYTDLVSAVAVEREELGVPLFRSGSDTFFMQRPEKAGLKTGTLYDGTLAYVAQASDFIGAVFTMRLGLEKTTKDIDPDAAVAHALGATSIESVVDAWRAAMAKRYVADAGKAALQALRPQY